MMIIKNDRLKFKEWLEGAESIPQQWRNRYKRYDYDHHSTETMGELGHLLPYEKKELTQSMSKARQRAIDMHKKQQGPIRVYHALVAGRSNDDPIDRIKSLVWTSKRPRSDEEISVSIHHGPWRNSIVMEGMATVLAYWAQDIYTTTIAGAEKVQTKMPKKISPDKYIKASAWDEALIPANRVKWQRVWYSREELERELYLNEIGMNEYINKLQEFCKSLNLELKEITGMTNYLPDKRFKQVQKNRKLWQEVEKIDDIANWMLHYIDKEENQELYSDILNEKTKKLQLSSNSGEIAMEKYLKAIKPKLKYVWQKYFQNNLFSLILREVFKKENFLDAKTARIILDQLGFMEENFNKASAQYEKAYQLLFDKPIKINMFDLFRKLIEQYPDSINLQSLGNNLISKTIFGNEEN
jgi:hypothetical protein